MARRWRLSEIRKYGESNFYYPLIGVDYCYGCLARRRRYLQCIVCADLVSVYGNSPYLEYLTSEDRFKRARRISDLPARIKYIEGIRIRRK